jgi:hypothetical protein
MLSLKEFRFAKLTITQRSVRAVWEKLLAGQEANDRTLGSHCELCYSECSIRAFFRLPECVSSGRSAAWLARLVRDQEAGGSNPLAPTIFHFAISPLSLDCLQYYYPQTALN